MIASRSITILAAAILATWMAFAAAEDDTAVPTEATAEQLAFFEEHVRPLLVERCQKCHGDATNL